MPHDRRLSRLTQRMFYDPDAPNQSYPAMEHGVKAAHVRALVPMVLQLAQRYNRGSDEDQHRELVMRNLQRYYEIIQKAGPVLTTGQATRLHEAANNACLHYSALASAAMRAGRLLWSIVPKFHYFLHLAEDARFANPTLSWNYKSEDFVGMIARAATTVRGTSHLRLSLTVATKYRAAMHIRWTRTQ